MHDMTIERIFQLCFWMYYFNIKKILYIDKLVDITILHPPTPGPRIFEENRIEWTVGYYFQWWRRDELHEESSGNGVGGLISLHQFNTSY